MIPTNERIILLFSPGIPMDFRSTLTGSIVETAIATLMHHAGYPVVRSSIESQFPPLPQLSQNEYARLDISPVLRQLPDLLLLPANEPARLVEVKYRTSLTRSAVGQLYEKVQKQQEIHPETHTIIARGRAPQGEKGRADDHLRCLPPHRLELLAAGDIFFHSLPAGASDEQERLEPMWRALRPMCSAFPLLQPHRDKLEQLVPLFRTLAVL